MESVKESAIARKKLYWENASLTPKTQLSHVLMSPSKHAKKTWRAIYSAVKPSVIITMKKTARVTSIFNKSPFLLLIKKA